MNCYKVMIVMGTRPEVIKLAPVIRELERYKEKLDHFVVTTAQHREMLDQVLKVFRITPDIDLDLMQHNQNLADFASRALISLSSLLSRTKPDAILIQGDTTTVMTASLAAFYQGIRIGHIEAGLRSFDNRNPFPEEINRRIATCLTDLHFAPTEGARRNLLREGVCHEKVFVTGNTIVDALMSMRLDGAFDDHKLGEIDFDQKRVLLVTGHRRENQGEPLRSICLALKMIATYFKDVEIVFPVHPNPNVSSVVREELDGVAGVHLVKPATYGDLLRLMNQCYLILTDSGGIQEEAPSFHKPVLVLREMTERPEVVEAGAAKVIGTNALTIVEEVERLLTSVLEYEMMTASENPFGDGHASERIVNILAQQLCHPVRTQAKQQPPPIFDIAQSPLIAGDAKA